MRQDVDEVGDLHLALCLVELAALRAPSVRIVCGRHDWVLDGVLESVRVQTTMAAPGGMVTIKDLLSGKTLHLACLEERVTLNSIDSGVCPRGGASSQVMLDW